MERNYIDLTAENLKSEHLACIIRTKTLHPGVEAKRRWLKDRLAEGHVFRKLDAPKATVFIEYAPLETAFVPIVGDNYLYLYCLWVTGAEKGKGYGRELMESCIADARRQGKSGVCMLGASKQKHWLADQSFAKKFGFTAVDATENGYELLALSFDGSRPRFADHAKKLAIDQPELTIYYDCQCPYIENSIEFVKSYCGTNDIPLTLVEVDTLEKAKSLPGVFNNYAVFYRGKFVTVNLILDDASIARILK